jgi:hypothetical protein
MKRVPSRKQSNIKTDPQRRNHKPQQTNDATITPNNNTNSTTKEKEKTKKENETHQLI